MQAEALKQSHAQLRTASRYFGRCVMLRQRIRGLVSKVIRIKMPSSILAMRSQHELGHCVLAFGWKYCSAGIAEEPIPDRSFCHITDKIAQ